MAWLPAITLGPAFLLSSIVGITNTSDIMVNDVGLVRSFRGVIWQKLKWDNVRLIRRREIFDGSSGKKQKYFSIIPIHKIGFSLTPGGKMLFPCSMAGYDEFIELINYYAKRNHLKLEDKINEIIKPVNNL